MTEALKDKVEVEEVASEIMTTVIENLETSAANARVLQAVLNEELHARKNVTVESISSSLDLGCFFVDEEHSCKAPSYRQYIHIGKEGGDAITGNVRGLVGRKIDGKPTLQLCLDVGYEEGPTLCYFNLDDTLEGCRIIRAGLGADSQE